MSDLERELLAKLEARVDAQEQMLASLTMAYAEVWVAIENIVNEILNVRTPEEQEEFNKAFREARKEMLKALKDASENGLEGVDSQLAATLARMVSGQ